MIGLKVAKSHGLAARLKDIYLFSRRELLFSRISSWVSLFFQIKRLSDSKIVLVIVFHTEHIPFHCIVCDNHLPRHVAQSSETTAGAWHEIECIYSSVFLVSRWRHRVKLSMWLLRSLLKQLGWKEENPRKWKGAAVFKCSNKGEWLKEYPIMLADGNSHAFYCVPCKRKVSCKHQWLADVKAHCAGRVHLSFEKAVKSTRKLDAMMSSSSSSSSLKEQVIRAELLRTHFMVHHNLSLLTAVHLSPLYVKMLPDSKLAKNFKCSRIKSTCILNGTMIPILKSSLVDYMMEKPFSILNDRTNGTAIRV